MTRRWNFRIFRTEALPPFVVNIPSHLKLPPLTTQLKAIVFYRSTSAMENAGQREHVNRVKLCTTGGVDNIVARNNGWKNLDGESNFEWNLTVEPKSDAMRKLVADFARNRIPAIFVGVPIHILAGRSKVNTKAFQERLIPWQLSVARWIESIFFLLSNPQAIGRSWDRYQGASIFRDNEMVVRAVGEYVSQLSQKPTPAKLVLVKSSTISERRK